jgi:hypothetical protein
MLAGDLVICPGAIGLLAVHAHAYGRPVVTSDNAEIHGPEIEAIVPGTTGELYRDGSVESLAEVAGTILTDPARLAAYGAAARQRAQEEYGIERMVEGFLAAIARGTESWRALRQAAALGCDDPAAALLENLKFTSLRGGSLTCRVSLQPPALRGGPETHRAILKCSGQEKGERA